MWRRRKKRCGLAACWLTDVGLFKIGLQIYTAEGPALIRSISSLGAKVFLDLKLHDIPNTVAKAVESAGKLGVRMLTIHLSGGSEMIRAAVSARSNDLLLLGVTVLTSSTDETSGGDRNRGKDTRPGAAARPPRRGQRHRWIGRQSARSQDAAR